MSTPYWSGVGDSFQPKREAGQFQTPNSTNSASLQTWVNTDDDTLNVQQQQYLNQYQLDEHFNPNTSSPLRDDEHLSSYSSPDADNTLDDILFPDLQEFAAQENVPAGIHAVNQ